RAHEEGREFLAKEPDRIRSGLRAEGNFGYEEPSLCQRPAKQPGLLRLLELDDRHNAAVPYPREHVVHRLIPLCLRDHPSLWSVSRHRRPRETWRPRELSHR